MLSPDPTHTVDSPAVSLSLNTEDHVALETFTVYHVFSFSPTAQIQITFYFILILLFEVLILIF